MDTASARAVAAVVRGHERTQQGMHTELNDLSHKHLGHAHHRQHCVLGHGASGHRRHQLPRPFRTHTPEAAQLSVARTRVRVRVRKPPSYPPHDGAVDLGTPVDLVAPLLV